MKPEMEKAVLQTLCYYQVFQYPLTAAEIWKFLSLRCCFSELKESLFELESLELIYCIDGYYSIFDNTRQVVRRINGNKLGKKKLKKARLISRFLGMFPFVEAICISGSLSKDFALPDSDLDYFIIASPNRLWTARNFMHLFRKMTFLVNAQDAFCMNYYISIGNSEILPKNLYTAIELATLKVSYAHNGLKELEEANQEWVSQFLPNCPVNLADRKDKKIMTTTFLEYLINKLGGDKIEKYFYHTTMKRWRKKWRKMNYDVDTCMRSAGPHFNTPVNYPEHLPNKILHEYAALCRETELKYEELMNIINPAAETTAFAFRN
jgi:hypothetical protein